MKLRLLADRPRARTPEVDIKRLEQLLTIHSALAQADEEQAILAALATYAQTQGDGCWLELHYIEPKLEPLPVDLRFAAGWYAGGNASDAATGSVDDLAPIAAWRAQPDLNLVTLEQAANGGALVMIPMICCDLLHGALFIGWSEARTISEDEQHIYVDVLPSIAAAVARRRAYIAEQQARQELEMLYRASAAINAANNAEQVKQALARLDEAMSTEQFSRKDGRIADAIRTLTNTAMDRVRLRRETEAARQRAEQYAAEAQRAAALEERNRLARQLHDSVSQALYGIALGARTARRLLDRGDPMQAKEPLDYLLSLAEAGLTEMRALIFDLRPDALETEGLIPALTKQANSIRTRHGIDVQVDFCDEPNVAGRVKEEIYRITREAMHNAVKHARATQIAIEARCDTDEFFVEVRDNGVGFDIQDSFPGHLGLRSMWERANRLGAELSIISAPHQGTRIGLHLPRALLSPFAEHIMEITR